MRNDWPAGWTRCFLVGAFFFSNVALLSGAAPVLAEIIGGVTAPTTTIGPASQPIVSSPEQSAKTPDIRRERAATVLAKLPVSFIANQGQTDDRVKFSAAGPRGSLFFTPGEVVYSLSRPAGSGATAAVVAGTAASSKDRARKVESLVLRQRFVGANPKPEIVGSGRELGNVNCYIGGDASKWRTAVPTFSEITYKDLYPGIDLVFKGTGETLEYDFVVRPGADPAVIRLAYSGIESLSVDALGDLLIGTPWGALKEKRPRLYQTADGKQTEVPGRFLVAAASDGRYAYGFSVEAYDHTRPLVIDPVLLYSSFLGGGDTDFATAIALDGSGNIFVTGHTYGSFPLQNPYQDRVLENENAPSFHAYDVFVSKINPNAPSASALVYSTYLGGGGNDYGYAIAVDAAGYAYVTGRTESVREIMSGADPAFPTTAGAFQPFIGGCQLLCGTDNICGNSDDMMNLCGADTICCTSDDPAYSPTSDWCGPDHTVGTADDLLRGECWGSGSANAFVTKFDPAGGLVYSTYLGGSLDSEADGIAVDSAGNAYVTGRGQDPAPAGPGTANFPTTAGAYQTTSAGGYDAFVTKLNTAGTALVYSTYLGGAGLDIGRAIAVNGSGNAYVAGSTEAPLTGAGYPTTVGAYQSTYGGNSDIFVTKVAATGASLDYSSLIGGPGNDFPLSIALDASGNAYLTGSTGPYSGGPVNFPTTSGAYQSTFGGGETDCYVTGINPTGSALVYSTYLGGVSGDVCRGIAVRGIGQAYVTGRTDSISSSGLPFPSVNAFQDTSTSSDAFVARLDTTRAGVSSLVYSTFIGGSGSDGGTGIAVDGSGAAYITGVTVMEYVLTPPTDCALTGTPFPTTPNAYDTSYNDGCFLPGTYYDTAPMDAFVAKISGNNFPEAVGNTYSTARNTTLTVAAPGVLANDTDYESSALTAILDTDMPSAAGTLVLNGDGSFTYNPATGYTGATSFTYKAFDGTDTSAAATVAIAVECTAGCPPPPPPNLRVTGGTGERVDLQWDAVTDPDIAGYKVYYGTSSGNYTGTINVGNVTFYIVQFLQEGGHYFAVKAFNVAGLESVFSNEVSKVTTCNTYTTYYPDADYDGYGNPSAGTQNCNDPAGYVTNSTDCDDTDASLTPRTEWVVDQDHDGYINSTATIQQCLSPGADYVRLRDLGVNTAVNGLRAAYFFNTQAPGFGPGYPADAHFREGPIYHGYSSGVGSSPNCGPTGANTVYNMYQGQCALPANTQPSLDWASGQNFAVKWIGFIFAPTTGDYTFGGWVDGSVNIVINGTTITNMNTTGSSIVPKTLSLVGGTWYPIWMLFWANGGSNNMVLGWTPPGGAFQVVPAQYLAPPVFGDCDDSNAAIHSGATELCGDGVDNNCDGQVDEGCAVWDADADGYPSDCTILWNRPCVSDCDDSNPAINPGATEICNGRDDNCNGVSDEGFADSDGDGIGGACDNCPTVSNPDQKDTDSDRIGDVCDADMDDDGVLNASDNCPLAFNPPSDWKDRNGVQHVGTQGDFNLNGVGDLCEPDADSDGQNSIAFGGLDCNDLDPSIMYNADTGTCNDGSTGGTLPPVGMAAADSDTDGLYDTLDNCPSVINPDQADTDGDKIGDACDTCPNDPLNDADQDGFCAGAGTFFRPKTGVNDNCPSVANPDQANLDGNSGDTLGNACDPDADADGVPKKGLDGIAGNTDDDCNDLNAAVRPGALEIYNNGTDDDCNPATPDNPSGDIAFAMTSSSTGESYGDWLPTDGGTATVSVTVSAPGARSVGPVTVTWVASKYPGKYTNDNNITDVSDDFTVTGAVSGGTIANGGSLTLTSKDYGGEILLNATTNVLLSDGVTTVTLRKDWRLPKNSDASATDHLPDAWERQYGDLTDSGDIDTSHYTLNGAVVDNANNWDGQTNIQEYRGYKWGGLALYSGTGYQTRAYTPTTPTTPFIRTNPTRKDIFVKYIGYMATGDYAFAIGDAFYQAEIDVHPAASTQTTAYGTKNLDVLSISLNTTMLYSTSEDAHINRRSVRDWTFDTLGVSGYGSATAIGTGTNLFKRSLEGYFIERPYAENTTNRMPGSVVGLDPLSATEDKNDNGVLDAGEDVVTAPAGTLNGDFYKTSVYNLQNTVFDVNNDGLYELPLVASPADAASTTARFSKAQIVKHVTTHEMGHAIGVRHNSVPTCLMYEFSTNWSRDTAFSDQAKSEMVLPK